MTNIARKLTFLTAVSLVIGVVSCTWSPWKKAIPQNAASRDRLKLVWISLDGLNQYSLDPLLEKMNSAHPKGLRWLLTQSHGSSSLKITSPTITAPSHISTLTCVSPGEHGIMDNNMWSGTGMVSGFGRKYSSENWVSALRGKGLRVGVGLYPSIDGSDDSRKADVGTLYDNPGSTPQLINMPAQVESLHVQVPARTEGVPPYDLDLRRDQEGQIVASTPWGVVGPLQVAKPVDIKFTAKIDGVERVAAISLMALSLEGGVASVEVSPVEVMPAYDEDMRKEIDQRGLVFSALKDYRIQNNHKAFLASMEHKQSSILAFDHMLLARQDLDAVFLYFEDIDTLLHAYYKDSVREADVVAYLERFDQALGDLITKIPATSDLVVLGDHGMSSINYVLNARKILGSAVASKGTVAGGGGALYFYPPTGDLDQAPPEELNLQEIAESLRNWTFEVTGQKIFGQVLVRGSKEAMAEGLGGDKVPWIMAFANDGIAFKNSVEDKLILARAKWAVIPEDLREKYPDPLNNGVLQTPVPAGQHGHWNELTQMRTRVILEGPRLSKLDPALILTNLHLVPAVADAEQWERPAGCKSP